MPSTRARAQSREAIAAGVELVEVSMLLGHSELSVTADLYSHLVKQSAAKAARHMDAALRT